MVIDVLHNQKMKSDLLPQKNKIQEVMKRNHIRRNEGMKLYTDSSKSLNSIIKKKYIHCVVCGLEYTCRLD